MGEKDDYDSDKESLGIGVGKVTLLSASDKER